MKYHLNLTLMLAIILASCDADDLDNTNGSLTIEVGQNALINQEGTESFFVVHAIGGEVLASSKLLNGELLTIDLEGFNEEFVNVTFIQRIEFSGFVTAHVNTFLEVGVDEKVVVGNLINNLPSSNAQAEIGMENLDNSLESIRLSRPGFFSVADPSFFNGGRSFDYSFLQEKPEIFVISQLSEGQFKYTSVELTPNSSMTVDLRMGTIMSESSIEVGNQGLPFYASLVGINNNGTYEDSYSMYSSFDLGDSDGTINLPIPETGTFDQKQVFLRAVDGDTSYDQVTVGPEIPESFTKLNAAINVINNDFENINFSVTGEYNIAYSSWSNEDKSLVWNIYGPEGQTSGFQAPALPEDILSEEFNQRIDQLTLSFIAVAQLDNLTYTALLNENSIIKSHRFFLANTSINRLLTKSVVNP